MNTGRISFLIRVLDSSPLMLALLFFPQALILPVFLLPSLPFSQVWECHHFEGLDQDAEDEDDGASAKYVCQFSLTTPGVL